MPKKTNKEPEERLDVVMLPVSELEPYAMNARKHSEEQVKSLAASIKSFGFTNPVLIAKNRQIIAGHGRVMAAKLAGLEQVPCIILANLSEAKIRAYTIADNQLASMASWDYDVLAAEIDALRESDFDVSGLGFSKEELDEMLGSPDCPPEPEEEKPKKESDTTICPKCHHEFVL
jgi:ParB-like chromosome segregation protein Spo0J